MPFLRTLLDPIFGFTKRQFVWFDPRSIPTVGEDGLLDMGAFLEELKPFTEEEVSIFQAAVAVGGSQLLEAWLATCLRNRGAYDYFYVLPLRGSRNADWIEHLVTKSRWHVSSLSTRGRMTETYSLLLHSLRQAVMLSDQMPAGFNDIWRQITITHGPVPRHEYSPDEPLQRATLRVVRDGVTLIVAAGNEGEIIDGNSLNPWCCAPWLISVGAADLNGASLLPSSSRGVNGLPFEAPTVVAPGEVEAQDGLNHVHNTALESIRGAPPNTEQMVVDGERVFVYLKKPDGKITVQMIQDDERPSPEASLESMLEWLSRERGSKSKETSGTSYAAEYVASVCRSIALHVKNAMPNLERSMRPKVVKTILEQMARPMKGYEPWEVGKGLVTRQIASEYLKALVPVRLAEICATAKTRWS